jgi:hypothetical protein
VVIGTDCKGSCASNNHTITTIVRSRPRQPRLNAHRSVSHVHA